MMVWCLVVSDGPGSVMLDVEKDNPSLYLSAIKNAAQKVILHLLIHTHTQQRQREEDRGREIERGSERERDLLTYLNFKTYSDSLSALLERFSCSFRPFLDNFHSSH